MSEEKDKVIVGQLQALKGSNRFIDAKLGLLGGDYQLLHDRTSIFSKIRGVIIISRPKSPFSMDEACEAIGATVSLPFYTGSIDAALTLVPGGWTRAVDATAPEHLIDVDLYPPDYHHIDRKRVVTGRHEKEAIATCIAAMLAWGFPK